MRLTRTAHAEAPDEAAIKSVAFTWIRGIGDTFATVLTRGVFYRRCDNRRQLASYVGMAPTPHQNGAWTATG